MSWGVGSLDNGPSSNPSNNGTRKAERTFWEGDRPRQRLLLSSRAIGIREMLVQPPPKPRNVDSKPYVVLHEDKRPARLTDDSDSHGLQQQARGTNASNPNAGKLAAQAARQSSKSAVPAPSNQKDNLVVCTLPCPAS